MKDLYSIHRDENDFWSFYELVKGAYSEIFRRIGFNFRIIEAGGGVFTQNKTHEFQVISDGGEDLIYYCNSCDWGQNQEIFDGKVGDVCPKCGKGEIVSSKSIEVGNIFPFGTYYSELMRIYFTDSDGSKKPPFFGSYGIGTTRIIGAWAEVSHDDKGIIWSRAIAPFDVHLLELGHGGSTRKKAQDVYKKLTKLGVDVLWDDRDLSAGEKFADSDLIGIPIRLVVSDGKNDLEYKERESEVTHRLTFEGLINMFDGK